MIRNPPLKNISCFHLDFDFIGFLSHSILTAQITSRFPHNALAPNIMKQNLHTQKFVWYRSQSFMLYQVLQLIFFSLLWYPWFNQLMKKIRTKKITRWGRGKIETAARTNNNQVPLANTHTQGSVQDPDPSSAQIELVSQVHAGLQKKMQGVCDPPDPGEEKQSVGPACFHFENLSGELKRPCSGWKLRKCWHCKMHKLN